MSRPQALAVQPRPTPVRPHHIPRATAPSTRRASPAIKTGVFPGSAAPVLVGVTGMYDVLVPPRNVGDTYDTPYFVPAASTLLV